MQVRVCACVKEWLGKKTGKKLGTAYEHSHTRYLVQARREGEREEDGVALYLAAVVEVSHYRLHGQWERERILRVRLELLLRLALLLYYFCVDVCLILFCL